ncbi:MAG: glycosyltransferase family 4 protein, partial [Candidatus Aenigmatarchaeota archaeon]
YGLSDEKVRVIENAIDTNKFRPSNGEERDRNYEYLKNFGISESDPYIYWKGRFVREKGADNLLRAFETFSPQHPDYHLVLTGFAGDIYHELLGIRNGMPEDVKNRITLINQQVNVLPFDQECAFAVYPSGVEAFGLMAVQSEACEKAVVAGNGGLRKNVLDNVTGAHIDPYNPRSIAEGMERAHENKGAWGKNARKFAVENYSWGVAIPKYQRVYEEVLGLN